jgi:hypothetical protein
MRETGRGQAEVELAVGRALEQFRGARIREFVPLLAEREARRGLHAWNLDPTPKTEPEARLPRGMSGGDRNGQDDR